MPVTHKASEKVIKRIYEIREETGWGCEKITRKLKKEGIEIGSSTVSRYLAKLPKEKKIKPNDELNEFKRKHELSVVFEKKKYKPIHIKQLPSQKMRTAFIIASDWHIEERVRPETIHGLNEFSVSIARDRARAFFANAVHLVKREKDVKDVVLALAGDFISGYIHEELEEGNNLSPTQALWEVYTMLRSGIEYMKENLPEHNISIPCVVGNHGRTTIRRRIESAVDNSFEWVLYRMLEENITGVDFNIADGKVLYITVYGQTMRITHGDQIRGGGGIGGIYPPILRKIAKWDNSRPSVLTIMGHFHQLLYHTHFVCNGSLVGYNAFAEEIGASPEKPKQAFFLWDEDNGCVSMSPIFLNN